MRPRPAPLDASRSGAAAGLALTLQRALALLAGVVTLKGRVDVERKVKGIEDEKAKE